jgi:hypothetical protein
MALSHPAMCRTDRLFQIINPAACAIACPQAPGDLDSRRGPSEPESGEKLFSIHTSIVQRGRSWVTFVIVENGSVSL